MMLFISPNYGEKRDGALLADCAKKRGVKVHTFFNSWSRSNNILTPNEKGAVYGEQAFCEFIAQEMRWNIYQNSLDWTARLHKSFLKRSVRCLPLKNLKNEEKQSSGILDRKYLMPADDKLFQSGIYTDRFPKAPSDCPILVSDIVDWSIKYRFIIQYQEIATYCCYRIEHIHNNPSIWQCQAEYAGITAHQFVSALLERVNCSPACVIDVGYIKGAGWAVDKTLPIWSSEIYGCRIDRFLDALMVSAVPTKAV